MAQTDELRKDRDGIGTGTVVASPPENGPRVSVVTLAARLWSRARSDTFLASSAWSLLSAVAGRGGTMVCAVICARSLGAAEFGKFAIVQSTIIMLSTYATLGLGITATRYVSHYRTTDKERASRILLTSSAIAAVAGIITTSLLMVGSSLVARRLLGDATLATSLVLAAPSLLFIALNAGQLGAMAGLGAFRRLTVANLISAVLNCGFFGLAVLRHELIWAVLALSATSVVTWAVTGRMLQRVKADMGLPRLAYRITLITREWRILLSFSLPALLTSAITSPAIWLCSVLLLQRPGGYRELALYSVGDKWRQLLIFPSTCIIAAALPLLSNAYGERRLTDARVLLWRQLKLAATCTSALCLIGLILSGPAMWVFGRDFSSGKVVLIACIASALPMVLNSVLGLPLVAAGRMWMRFTYDLFLCGALVAGATVFIPLWGGAGAAVSQMLAYGCCAVPMAVHCSRILRQKGVHVAAVSGHAVVAPVYRDQ